AIAARLAKAGYKVTVLEKNDFTGGRCSLIHHEGYRFDQGPSLLLLPQLFHETFRDLDTTIADSGVDLLRCQDVNYNVWFHDGELFKHSSDLATMKVEVERWEGKEGFARYLSWMREAHTHYEVSVTGVLHRNFTSLFNLARPSLLKHVVALHPLESIYARASRYFWTERLRRVFTFAVMYMGIYCDSPGVTSVTLSFVNKSPRYGNDYPGTNFAGHCGGEQFYVNPVNGEETSLIMNCDAIKTDIRYCQSIGKKVLLSIGG
ncbi:hypothetical protein BN1708_017492, partial [Verticillium longisporum]